MQEKPTDSKARTIDFAEINARISAWGARLDLGFERGDEHCSKVLAERARLLAREPDCTGDGESIDVVEFRLGEESYAFESSYVSEVYTLRDLTPLPCTPPFVLGIVNVRGQILSVIDLNQLLDLRNREPGEDAKIIILSAQGARLGVLADKLIGVRSIRTDSIQASLVTLTGLRAELLKGVNAEGLAIMDAEAIISDQRLVVNEEVVG